MIKIEVCAFSLESCITAERAGANRIELCNGIFEGGTTPSAGLILEVLKNTKVELFVMIRPRGGDFLYSETEKQVMRADILQAKKLGAHGIVLGLLQENGEVDLKNTKEMVELARPMETVFHRAIDVTPNPFQALEAIIESGCIRILTSGQQNKAIDGIDIIAEMIKKANSRIEIMAGSSVNAENTLSFLQVGVNAVHLTGKSIRQSAMQYRKPNVSMSDIAGISEFDISFTDSVKIKNVVDIVNSFLERKAPVK